MTVRAYYATHSTGSYTVGRVVLLDDENERDRGLASTGYFEQITTPEVAEDGDIQGEDRAR